jgi:steroid delta-isomerase-like uncharacterized protein
MTRTEAERLFAARVAAWRERDVDALGRFHTDDCVLESPIAGTVTGRAAIENVYGAFFTSFPDVAIDDIELFIDSDRVVQTVTFSGTNTGGFMGMPLTGKRFTFAAVQICRFRDGLIAHERRIYDFTGFLLEIGVLKAKPV